MIFVLFLPSQFLQLATGSLLRLPNMLSSVKTYLAALLLVAPFCSAAKQPLIFDSDYGPFIDDVFALGLLVNSLDLVDLKLVLATSDRPELSATCIAAHLELSGHSEIEVAVGSPFPDYSERGSVCAIEGILGFAMEPECNAYTGLPPIENGVEYMANMIMDSGRDDWWYLVVGGQSSLRALIETYPEAAAKVDTVIVMAGTGAPISNRTQMSWHQPTKQISDVTLLLLTCKFCPSLLSWKYDATHGVHV